MLRQRAVYAPKRNIALRELATLEMPPDGGLRPEEIPVFAARDLNWEDVKTFAVVAEEGSVRKASRALEVHHSTVSRRVTELEAHLEVRLFDRTPEGYVLTPAGEELANVATECGIRLNDAGRRVSGRDEALAGSVRVTMPEPVLTYAIGPRLGEFAERYPLLELEILATINLLDVGRREADIAIRLDNNPPEQLVGKRFFPFGQSVYASAAYIARHDLTGQPESARWLGWGPDMKGFHESTEDTEFARAPIWGNFPDLTAQHAAARAGLGLAMLPCFTADYDPGLQRVTSREPIMARDIWLLTHADLRRTARIRAFMTFAEEVIREHKDRFQGVLPDGGVKVGCAAGAVEEMVLA